VFLWRGAWWAEVDVDPDTDPVTVADVPAGPVVLTITPAGAAPIVLKGTVVPQDTGRMVSSVKVHILAGGAGWTKALPAQQFNQPAGLTSAAVEQATAALVGEVVVDAQPVGLGTTWVREGPPNPASSVFGDRQWYVDTNGITQVQPWPVAAPAASFELLAWDPIQQRGDCAADALVLPGTVITDARFDGSITVRDVEMVFDKAGVRATVWCSAVAVTRLVSALTNMVRVLGQLAPLKIYRYRVVLAAGAMWTLQPVPEPDGTPSPMPPLVNVPVWPGMFGLSCTPTLSAKVGVMFLDGNREQPVVVSYDGTLPVVLNLDATGVVNVGATAPFTKMGKTPAPLAAGLAVVGICQAAAAAAAALATLSLTAGPWNAGLASGTVTAAFTALAAAFGPAAAALVPTKTVLGGP
jgi:hypothetical protein